MHNNPAAGPRNSGPPPPPYGSENEYGYRTKAGMGVIPQRMGLAVVSQTGFSGIIQWNFFRACKDMPANRWDMGVGTAAGATPTLIKGALYAVDPSYNLTQLAVSPNDTSLLSTASAKFGKAFSTPWNMAYNSLYAFGFLHVTAAAAPTILGLANAGAISHWSYDTDPRMTAVTVGQTDFLASYTAAQLSASNTCLWAELS